jgi:gliding motility-associated-like protein
MRHRLIPIINIYRIFAVASLFMALFSYKAWGQSLGDPIVNITFGSGTATRPGPLQTDSGTTTYIYAGTGFPNDGYYTIANSTAGMLPGWWTTTDHTGNAGGYMMIVNGSYQPGIFYTRTVAGLCGSTKYQFAAWLKNLLNYNGILPNVTFSIETTSGTVLGTGTTGDIPTANTWVQYPFTFTTPTGIDNVVIKMTNNAPGGIGNDIAIDDITFRPYGDPVSAALNSSSATTQTFCAGTSQTITISAASTLASGYSQKLQQQLNGVWTDQSAPTTNSSFSIASPTIAGTYHYRLVTGQSVNISSSECVVASNELLVTVAPTPTASFTGAASTCLGSPTPFVDKSTTGGGTISSWQWDFGDGQTNTSQNPLHTYAAAGNYTVNLTVTNSNGCTAAAMPLSVHISSLPVALFSYSTPDCVTSAVTLTDKSTFAEGTITTWAWDYGDGAADSKTTNATFQHIYTATGNYTVQLVVTTNTGCVAQAMQTIVISPLPVVDFITPDVCLADASAMFTDGTTITDGSNSQFTYLWNFGDAKATAANPNTSTAKNPSHKYSKADIYQVSLTVTSNNGCVVNKTKSFTVNGSIPVANFNILNPADLCSNREVLFTNQSTVDFGSITKIEIFYDYGNNPTVVETDDNPTPGKLYRHTYPQFHTPSKMNYQVRMLAYSGGTCVSEKDVNITLLATPQLTFNVPSTICLNAGTLQLSATENSGISGSGVYSGTGISSTGLFNPEAAGVGKFTITYVYTAINACADTLSGSITVNSVPTVNAGTDVTVLQGGNTTFAATAIGDSLTYARVPTAGLSSANILNPVVTPIFDITYTLTAINKLGCSASASIKVKVLKAPIVPNGFTPNGDGVNDTWNIKYLDTYPDCTVEVFNRNGLKVYSSIGYPAPWDGTFNGALLAPAVYYYLINPKHGRSPISGWVTIIK